MSKNGWKYYKIKEIGQVITGKTPPTKERRYFGSDRLFVRIPDMGRSVRVKESEMKLSNEGFEYLRGCSLPKGAVTVSCIATVGKVGITDQECCTNQQINSVIPDADLVIPEWIYYYIKNNTADLESLGGGGSVYTNISKSRFEEFEIVIPPLPTQKQIAKILGDLDEKIELNHQMNKTLESIAQAVFKKWFVDFEFPGHEKTKFVNGLPEGWREGTLGEFADILNGFAFKSEDFVSSGVFLLRTRNFAENGYIVRDDTACLPESFYDQYKSFRLKKFDVLLVMVGASVGKMAIVQSSILPALQNQNMWNFRSKSEIGQLYLNFLVKKIVKENIGVASGSARDFFRKDFFREIDLILPEEQILRNFDKTTISLFEQIDKNLKEIDVLSQLRNSLLPKLMAGEVAVAGGAK